MADELHSNLVLDLQGLLCPIPVVRMAKAIKEVPVGGVIEATATDPGVLADIPAWCKSTGNELLKTGKEGKVIRFWVKRLK
jgi:tRNA 2-thiouridine synthesizing protein A